MNIAFRNVITVSQYLAWAATKSARKRTELINGQIVDMAPERIGHIELKFAATSVLKSAIALAGLHCHALADGATIQIDEHTAYEPDALVYCGEKLSGEAMIVPNPIIILEVLSPTTAHMDTSAKLIGYFKLPSVRHYLIVDPDARTVTHHARGVDGVMSARTASDGTLRLDPPGIEFSVANLFA